eukprot:scaffold4582_cov56-Attheya_sp.AAC.3
MWLSVFELVLPAFCGDPLVDNRLIGITIDHKCWSVERLASAWGSSCCSDIMMDRSLCVINAMIIALSHFTPPQHETSGPSLRWICQYFCALCQGQ